MSKPIKYFLVSLPTSISPSNDHDEALTALRSAVTTDYASVFPFEIPEFKIGSLDALVHQADDLAKLEAGCEGVVGKVGDSLRTILEGDEERIRQNKTVNDSQWIHSRRISMAHAQGVYRTCRCIPQDFPVEQGQIQSRQTNSRAY